MKVNENICNLGNHYLVLRVLCDERFYIKPLNDSIQCYSSNSDDFFYYFGQLFTITRKGSNEYFSGEYSNTGVYYPVLKYGTIIELESDISNERILGMLCEEKDIEFCKNLILANQCNYDYF